MNINFSNIRNSFYNFNFNDSTVGKFVNENKKAIQVVALSALSLSTAYVVGTIMYNAPGITAEDACHELLKNGLGNLPALKAEEYELTSSTFDKEALTDTTQTKVYLTCVAKLTEKVTDQSLRSHLNTDYNIHFSLALKQNKILAEKEFRADVNFLKT